MKCYKIHSANTATGNSVVSARMCLPSLKFSGLAFAAIERDTRALHLDASQRFNYFPSAAMCSVVWVLHGDSHIIVDSTIPPKDNPILPKLSFIGPFDRPFASWSPKAVHSICIGFYPERWADLTGLQPGEFLNRAVPLNEVIGGELYAEFEKIGNCNSVSVALDNLEKSIGAIWQRDNAATGYILSDWVKGLAMRTAMSGTGQSLRQMQRRIKTWTGQSRRTLEKTARMETLHREVLQRQASGNLSLAKLAHDLGYADQSHMGREFRNMTGLSPRKIGRLAELDENYWCYKLLGERFL